MWGWWGLLAGDLEMLTQVAGVERGVLPVLAWVLKVQDEGDGLCMVGTACPEPSVGSIRA